ncbi:MAG: hypothetical protein HYU48_00740 [Candidatus Levybacteria bacterium]|nr:hypothetical protein [Candidatus Levybacteria bacterium]
MTERFQPNNLTNRAQNPYPESMPEPGQGEIQPPVKPVESIPPSGEQAPDINKLVTELKGIPEDVLRKAAQELSKKQGLPTEEAQQAIEKRKAEVPKEARHLEPAVNMVAPPGAGIDMSNMQDPELIAEINNHNREVSTNSLSVESANRTISNLEKRVGSPGISAFDRNRAREIIDQLTEDVQSLAERERAEQLNAARSRLNRNLPEHFFTREQLASINDVNDTEGLEEIFNGLFKNADAQPNREFSDAFNQLTDQPIYAAFIDALGRAGRDADSRRFVQEFAMRQIIHNAGYVFYSGIDAEKLSGFLQPFRADLADLAFSKKGVADAAHLYEQALLKVREEHGGYIPAFEVDGDPTTGEKGRVEILLIKYLNEAIKEGQVDGTQKGVDQQGKPIYEMAEWEINRAIAFARGMGIIVGRVPEIAASSVLPELPTEEEQGMRDMTGGRLASLWGQDVIKSIAPFRHSIYKFDIGGAANRVFSYITNRGRKPWEYKELQEWVWDKQVDIINNVADDKRGYRYLQRLNPFRIGGIFSRTTWRYSNDPTASALGDMSPGDMDWIGTGMQIEKNRGDLSGHNAEKSAVAEANIRGSLDKISNILPLRLFYNLRDVQGEVLRNIGSNMNDPLLIGDKDNPDSMGDLDRLVILQNRAVKDRAQALNFDLIEDPAQRERIIKLTATIKKVFTEGNSGGTKLDEFVENLKHREWEVPFIFGTDDLPYDRYKFAKTGATSIARRWRDIANAKLASDATHKLVEGMAHFKSPEQIVEVLAEVYKGVAGYDAHIAEAVVADYAEGIMKFYGKDWYSRLPLGIGTITDKLLGRASFAQASFGRGAMAWNELQLNDFTGLLRDGHLITREIQQDLQKRAGGGKKEVAWGLVRTIAPLLMLAFIYYMMSRIAKEK